MGRRRTASVGHQLLSLVVWRTSHRRALLSEDDHPYQPLWELDVTSRKDREKNGPLLDIEFEKSMERRVRAYIRENFSFCTFSVESKEDRLKWESRIVSTLAQAKDIRPSEDWLGHHSPKERIRTSGLWQVNELYNTPLSADEFLYLSRIAKGQER